MLRFICLGLVLLSITIQFTHTFSLQDIKDEYDLILDSQQRIRTKIINSELIQAEHNLFNKSDIHSQALASTYKSFGTRYNYGGCTCEMLFCICCARIHMPQIDLNSSIACLHLKYNNSLNTLSTEFTLKDRTVVMTESWSLKNSDPEFCYEVVENKTVCLKYYGFVRGYGDQMMKGCVEVSGKEGTKDLATVRLGCFSMFAEVGHKYFLKDIVSIHAAEGGKITYISRHNPVVFSPFFF